MVDSWWSVMNHYESPGNLGIDPDEFVQQAHWLPYPIPDVNNKCWSANNQDLLVLEWPFHNNMLVKWPVEDSHPFWTTISAHTSRAESQHGVWKTMGKTWENHVMCWSMNQTQTWHWGECCGTCAAEATLGAFGEAWEMCNIFNAYT